MLVLCTIREQGLYVTIASPWKPKPLGMSNLLHLCPGLSDLPSCCCKGSFIIIAPSSLNAAGSNRLPTHALKSKLIFWDAAFALGWKIPLRPASSVARVWDIRDQGYLILVMACLPVVLGAATMVIFVPVPRLVMRSSCQVSSPGQFGRA